MKSSILLLLVVVLASCGNINECSSIVDFDGQFRTKDVIKQMPHWNDTMLVFEGMNQARDTIIVSNQMTQTIDRHPLDIEHSMRDFVEVNIDLNKIGTNDKSGRVNAFYECKSGKLKVTLYWPDFWDWATLTNGTPTGPVPGIELPNFDFHGKRLANTFKFEPDTVRFPGALDEDVKYIIWNLDLGVMQYYSRASGLWTRVE